jgi:hypothetical protein
MSIQQNFPSTRPSLNLNFSRSQKLDPRITFTRTSSATRVNSDGLIEVVSANSPRFDFDPISGESLGLLVEEQRVNYALQSENLDFGDSGSSTGWYGLARASILANDILSPNNTLTADKIVANTDNNSHNVTNRTQNGTTNNANPITVSIYFKPAGETKAWLYFTEATTYARTITSYYDLTGNGSTVTPTVGNGASSATSNIIALPNGWYRCILTGTLGGTDTRVEVRLGPSQSTSTNIYAGNNVDGVYAWGLQVEQGSFPTSYIPTTTSTVTRTADNASITGSNFSDFYNPSEGTIVLSAISRMPDTHTLNRSFAIFGDGTYTYQTGFYKNTGIAIMRPVISNVGLTGTTLTKDLSFKAALSMSSSLNQFCYNGSFISSSSTPISSQIDRIHFYDITGAGIGHPTATISSFQYYPVRLPQNQLQTLTK